MHMLGKTHCCQQLTWGCTISWGMIAWINCCLLTDIQTRNPVRCVGDGRCSDRFSLFSSCKHNSNQSFCQVQSLSMNVWVKIMIKQYSICTQSCCAIPSRLYLYALHTVFRNSPVSWSQTPTTCTRLTLLKSTQPETVISLGNSLRRTPFPCSSSPSTRENKPAVSSDNARFA